MVFETGGTGTLGQDDHGPQAPAAVPLLDRRDRVVIALAAGQLGRCPESRSWAPVRGAEMAGFTKELARMHAALDLQDPCL